jgi:endonuclease/exonuclease/phosphatase family metal-dependent hydrolase
MTLKILSWNVEHFTGHGTGTRAGRVARVADLIKAEDPDIFALMEVEGSTVFSEFTQKFPGFSFAVTEGAQVQEIMIGWRSGVSAFMTQRDEFKSGNMSLRPAALLTVTSAAQDTLSLLFSHLKSFPSPEGYGLRDGMIEKARSLKGAIDRASNGTGKFILLGDLNTMGMTLTFSDKDLSEAEEIARIDRILAYRKLRRLAKSHPHTFNNGSTSTYLPANLDHVYASDNCTIPDVAPGVFPGVKIRVAGWAELADVTAQDQWIGAFSDHAPLIFSVEGF